ncbi:hypothetical protein JX265_003506 [Neoarthrinium moseri]|uniref:N-acetyltransferase domain-containing protein n=1 Tax=Neoarthrinium moseri TaxID=1658444 RepID=A0A9P9WSB9_9PEZI|nr:uncharacterized protein JN550_002253 [Neoarthrinium moseri]KAI1850135.1 hypothetical protein JX266_004514 [Neoarthrinium moseri]KAI1874824.1 hypothetical protein JN550_002253 [Neoarthrinium moseri]KAI1877498.1 hypothetical protein JX265_003506 [Neoarthrinium moseri]
MANLQVSSTEQISSTTVGSSPGAAVIHLPAAELKKQRSLIPERWADQVRAIGISEYKEAGLSIAQAFATDELAHYLLDSDDMAHLAPEAKWKLHVDMMKYIVAAHCYSGLVTTIGPDYEGVALWAPPGTTTDDWLTTLRSGAWRLYYQLSSEGWRRYNDELLPLLHHTKAEVMGDRDDDCYYLVYIGTKPSGQRRGYARKLIEAMAAKADAENRAMYLESSSERNSAYYRKFGFEPRRDIFLGAADGESASAASKPPVRLSIMVREPQTVAGKSIPIKLGAGFKRLQ